MKPAQITRNLVKDLQGLEFSHPVTHVYNPLDYAQKSHLEFLKKYGTKTPREAVFLGMNPGPWGMVQTGVPFGEITMVRDWMKIAGVSKRPENEHPKRMVEGFSCTRSEVSGARLWEWAKERFKTPDRFFSRFMVLNYCPLSFMEESGKNRTPDKLPVLERAPVEEACNRALLRFVKYYEPKMVIGVGAFAEKQAKKALGDLVEKRGITIGRILHPSPASPAANRGWAEAVEKQLKELGVRL